MSLLNILEFLYASYLFNIYISFLIIVLLFTIYYKNIKELPLRDYSRFIIFLLIYFLFIYAYTLIVYFAFDQDFASYQLIQTFNFYRLSFNFAVDNLSLLFLLLTSFIMPLCILLHYNFSVKQAYCLANNKNISLNFQLKNSTSFIILLFLLFIILFIFFTTLDFFIFFVSFESSVIPLFLFINLYGSRLISRLKASYYMFFFTTLSSITFLLSLFFIFYLNGSLNILFLSFNTHTADLQRLLWFSLFIPVASKIPVVPFHIWLPEAHVEAPTEGSVLLASLMLKLGAYFLLRFLIPLLPLGLKFFIPLTYSLFTLSLLYTSCLIFLQIDLKKIIAYSSIAHMNLGLLGLFSGTMEGVEGSLYMFFTHGIISSGLFICIGWLYSRFHTRIVLSYTGITFQLPLLSLMFFIFVLGNLSFPGMGSFVSELLIILSVFQKNLFLGALCLLSSFLCTLYSFLLYTRVFFGSPLSYFCSNSINTTLHIRAGNTITAYFLTDQTLNVAHKISRSEYFILFFLALYTLFTGFFPTVYLNFVESYSYQLLLTLNF